MTAALAAAATVPQITDLQPIMLHDGVNSVPEFFPDHSAATIVQAWRDNGNAHSHREWLIFGASAGHVASVVTFDDPDRANESRGDVISDAPFDGERVLANVRFARGTVDGHPAMLMLQAQLGSTAGRPLADHETATVRVFSLVATDGSAGVSPFVFRPISTIRTAKRYCNAALALSQTLPVPLPDDYEGFNESDGCFSH